MRIPVSYGLFILSVLSKGEKGSKENLKKPKKKKSQEIQGAQAAEEDIKKNGLFVVSIRIAKFFAGRKNCQNDSIHLVQVC